MLLKVACPLMLGSDPANDNLSDDWLDMLIGGAVRRRREELGLSLEGLADRAGLSAPDVGHYEAGEWRIPSWILVRLADALDAPLAQFLKAI